MCSISGFIAEKPLNRQHARALCTSLLYYGAERGQQSSGIYLDGKIYKKAQNPHSFVETSEFFNLFDQDVLVSLCHTRAPTSGGLNDEQAQPFSVNDTATVHNGFFFDLQGLKDKWGLVKKSGVDSELITRFTDAYGIEFLPDFLESVDGPSAIAALYKKELYLMRSGNPLSFTTLEFHDNKLLVFASTPSILFSALKYVWLIPTSVRGQSIKENVLIHATPEGLTLLSDPISPTYSSRRLWSIYDMDYDTDYDIPTWHKPSEKLSKRERKRLIKEAFEKEKQT